MVVNMFYLIQFSPIPPLIGLLFVKYYLSPSFSFETLGFLNLTYVSCRQHLVGIAFLYSLDSLSSEGGVYSIYINDYIVTDGLLLLLMGLCLPFYYFFFCLSHNLAFLYVTVFFGVKYFLVYNFYFSAAFLVVTIILSHSFSHLIILEITSFYNNKLF